MKKYIFIAAGLLTLTGTVNAQKKKSIVKFNSMNSIGFLTGQTQSIFTIQSINGIKYKTWFAGLGASMDRYGYQSIPVFADIRKSFGNKAWHPFVYADAGINYPIYSALLPRKESGNDAYRFRHTFYGETGVGLEKAISTKTTFMFSAGFSYKHFSYLQYGVQNPIYQNSSATLFDFFYRRLSIKTGVVL